MTQIATVLACTLFGSGCTQTVTRDAYAAHRELLIGSKQFYQSNVAECARRLRVHPNQQQLKEVATMINSPIERTPELLCERFATAARDGRLSYELFLQSANGDFTTPEVKRIARGR